MCRELSEEMAKGLKAAEDLVDHALYMGASGGKIPVGGWIVEVRQPATDEERVMCKLAIDKKLEVKHVRHLSIVKEESDE